MKSALDVHQRLLAKGIAHEVVRLGGTALSADDLPGLLDVEAGLCVTVRCYRVDDARTPDGAAIHLAAVAARAGQAPDLTSVRKALGAAAVRLASPDEISAHTDFAAALVCPIGLPEDVVLLADTALAAAVNGDPRAVRYCATGESGTALAIGLRDLLVESGARVASLTPVLSAARDTARAGVARPGRPRDGAQVISLSDAKNDRGGGRTARTAG